MISDSDRSEGRLPNTDAVRVLLGGGPRDYRGPHDPQPDGLCVHRWANRVTRTVGGCCVAAVAAYKVELAEKVRGELTYHRVKRDDADRDRDEGLVRHHRAAVDALEEVNRWLIEDPVPSEGGEGRT